MKFSEMRRPETPERRARIDAIKSEMAAAEAVEVACDHRGARLFSKFGPAPDGRGGVLVSVWCQRCQGETGAPGRLLVDERQASRVAGEMVAFETERLRP